MKEMKEKVKGFLCLPISEATEKKIGEVDKLEATVIQNGLVLMKSQMTAMEAIKTIEGLEDVIDALYFTLASAAGVCRVQGCQAETMDAVDIKLPEFILEDAGISKDAKLCAYTDEGSGEVTVIEAEYKHDLMKAIASVNLNGQFAVHNVKVMEGSKGLFISMPSYRSGNGQYRDICFPVTNEFRQQFNQAVLDAYQQTLVQGQKEATQQQQPPAEVPEHKLGMQMSSM